MAKKPKGEVHEVISALEHLSAQSGSRPDVVQNKRDCFQVRLLQMAARVAGASCQEWGVLQDGASTRLRGATFPWPEAFDPLLCCLWRALRPKSSLPKASSTCRSTCPPPLAAPLQKLIRYMTQGIDMSAAFVPATKCVALSKHDLPLKKMLYLYLRTAAKQNAAVALLVVQVLARRGDGVRSMQAGQGARAGELAASATTCSRMLHLKAAPHLPCALLCAPPPFQNLLNDCKDLDPTIRGLAVRSMCSLRVPELMENVVSASVGHGAWAVCHRPASTGQSICLWWRACRTVCILPASSGRSICLLWRACCGNAAPLRPCSPFLPPPAVRRGRRRPAGRAPVRARGGGDGRAQMLPPRPRRWAVHRRHIM